MIIKIPDEIKEVFARLRISGYEAYLVGGCVRDSIIGIEPDDYDITTNATPERIIACMEGFKVIPTGLKHGTVTVINRGVPVEITTYRSDGEYIDHRRPEGVVFAKTLSEDLSRRDFTINAIAYSEKEGFIDLFGGIDDIKKGIIRCIGNPFERFDEDALRIMRAIRFSSKLGYKIDSETNKNIHGMRELLKYISAERIRDELIKLIMGKNVRSVLVEYYDVLSVFIPEILPCVRFEQHNKYHKYDVWEHIATAVGASCDDKIVRIAMLLHDIEKPKCFSLDDVGQGHFYKHEYYSAITAHEILKRLKFDNDFNHKVCILIARHYFVPILDNMLIKKTLGEIGEDAFFRLINVQRADASAKNDFCLDRLKVLDAVEKSARRIIADGECYQIKMLDINGNDLKHMGLEGREIGSALSTLLNAVINLKVENKKEKLKEYLYSLTE